VVYSKRPFGGPEAVLAYLSRYTHRVAISNSRLLACDGDGVAFKYKDYRANGRARQKVMRLAKGEFIRRFLIHVLPTGFHRIRHYGLFASGVRAQNIAHARELLAAAIPPKQDKRPEDADRLEPRILAHPCPCCGGRMIVIETFERGRAPRGSSLGEIRTTPHDQDRLTRNAATRLSFAADRSTAPLALAQWSSGRLSRARPPRKTSSHCRQTTPLRRPLSVEIVFDGHCDHSPTAAGDSQIPIARGGG
jgi:hypothetical protein